MKKAAAFILVLAVVPLVAAEPQFGVQGALSLPMGDLNDNGNPGLQAGAHARWYFKEGHGLMARADVGFYGSNHGTTVTGFGLGADYTYHFDRHREGLYLLAGLSEMSYHTSYPDFSRNDNALGFDLGAGYDVDRHLGVQGRFTSHSLDHLTYQALNLGVTYSF